MHRTLLNLSILALAGCAAAPPPMDRTQYLAATTRNYTGFTKEQIISAASTVLSLSDAAGYDHAHTDDGFVATHEAIGLGSRELESWDFKVRETPSGARAAIQVSSSMTTSGLVPTTAVGVYSVGSSSIPSSVIKGDALYDLFWARMDYFLWKRDDWTTCEDQYKRTEAGKVHGSTDALCRRGTPDDAPGKLRAVKLVRRGYDMVPVSPPTIAPDRTK